MKPTFNTALLLLAGLAPAVRSLTSYANDFVDPDLILAKNYSKTTLEAQATIVQWANDLAAQGPWSVMSKSVTPPTGNKHTYMSWAPYYWANCSNVGNTTELTPEQIWVQCDYSVRDGQFSPDVRLVNDTGNFQALGDAVLYNSMAWVITGDAKYSKNAATFVSTWFTNNDTAMLPNLDYAQMQRGPDGQHGTHTGILDTKGMAKIVSGVLMLRKGKSPDWTTELDNDFTSWVTQFVDWLQTNPISLEEKAAENNHGTFYYNQVAALQVYLGDMTGAQATVREFFTSQYLTQIEADGEQPLEAARTRPYHYRAYNLAAMITNARIGKYAGYDAFQVKATSGATIQTALDFTLTTSPGTELAAELYPNIAAVAAIYGDPTGKYAAYLKAKDPEYVQEAYFLWNQPLSDSGLAKDPTKNSSGSGKGGSGSTGGQNNGAIGTASTRWTVGFAAVLGAFFILA